MTFKKGDFVTFDYTAKIKETGKIFDTSIKEVAEKEKINKQGETYESRLIVIGEGWILKSLDDELLKMEIDKPSTVEILPAQAFGERDPDKVKEVPLKVFIKMGIRPVIGQRVQYSGQTAIVRSVSSGRVLLDSNQFLAGKTLVYELTVKSNIDKIEDKILALIHRRFPSIEEDKFKLTINGETLAIEVPNEALNMNGLEQAKRGIATDVQKFFSDITVVNFLESFKAPSKVIPPQPQAKTGVDAVIKKPIESDTKKV